MSASRSRQWPRSSSRRAPSREQRVARLRDTLNALKADDAQLTETIARDLAFHRRLCELSDNHTLLDTWTHLLARIRATIIASGPAVTGVLATYKRHAVIVDAIADGDETTIRDVLLDHMREAATRIAQSAADSAERSRAATP